MAIEKRVWATGIQITPSLGAYVEKHAHIFILKEVCIEITANFKLLSIVLICYNEFLLRSLLYRKTSLYSDSPIKFL